MRYERIEVDWRDPRFEEAFYGPDDLSSVDAAREARFLRKLGAIQPGDAVLDLGCGPGKHALAMTRAGMFTVALDQSPHYLADVIREGKSWGVNVDAVRADIEALPFLAERFDLVYMLRSPFHFHVPLEQVLQGIAYILRPHGRLVLWVYNRDWRSETDQQVLCSRDGDVFVIKRKLYDEHTGIYWETDLCVDAGANKVTEYVWWTPRYSRDEVRAMLERSGMAVSNVASNLEGDPWVENWHIMIFVAERR